MAVPVSGPVDPPDGVTEAWVRAVRLFRNGELDEAISLFRREAARTEPPDPGLCLQLARCYGQAGAAADAFRWATAVVDGGSDYASWQGAANLIPAGPGTDCPGIRRVASVSLLGSATTAHFAPLLKLAAARFGIALDVHEAVYGQYQQELLDSNSGTCQLDPDFILLAVDTTALTLPGFCDAPEEAVEAEAARWIALWRMAAGRTGARVLQFNFPVPPEEPMGHLSARLPGARSSMIGELNRRLGREAGNDVLLVDCERLAATVGKHRWFDPRYWYLAKEAVSPEALPVLARHTAAVIAGALGMSRKCLVLDLDNTLWGGVIGEDGVDGIRLGQGPDGEAFTAFQEYLLSLKQKGIILAVCSKNNEDDAMQPFREHPEMRLKLDDIAMFVANWQHKPDNLRAIAQSLDIGLESLVLVDDNPVEREAVRELAPEVEVVPLPDDPAYYIRALAAFPLLETSALTTEDARRTEQYRARAQSIRLRASSDSLESFYKDLCMKAVIAPFDDFHVPRIVQLIGKTNQFNLTARRHGLSEVRAFMADPEVVTCYLRLSDRFTDHGLVAVIIARRDDADLDIDTWLMSCRVIGRTVESAMLAHLCRRARELKCTRLRGTYIPTAKNRLVSETYSSFGFRPDGGEGGVTRWTYDLDAGGDISNEYIEVVENAERS